jgi:CTP:molybdopterin cytidylyltransferase MocA
MPSGCVRSAQVIYYSSEKPCIPTIERVVGKGNYRIGIGIDVKRGLFKNHVVIDFSGDDPQVVSTVLKRLVDALGARDFVIIVAYWDGRFRMFEGRVPSPGEL